MILASKAREACLARQYDALFQQIYQDDALVSYQRARYAEALLQYIRLYGDGEIEIYSAPGRSEIGGNHTDHQHGCVLAAAVNLDIIAIAGRASQAIQIQSDDFALRNRQPVRTPKRARRFGSLGTRRLRPFACFGIPGRRIQCVFDQRRAHRLRVILLRRL